MRANVRRAPAFGVGTTPQLARGLDLVWLTLAVALAVAIAMVLFAPVSPAQRAAAFAVRECSGWWRK